MSPAIIIGIIVLCVCLISSSVGGYYFYTQDADAEDTAAAEEDTITITATDIADTNTGTVTDDSTELGETVIEGCTVERANNYDSEATVDDGNCIIEGCTAKRANNYDSGATVDDGNCVIVGCMLSGATNYDSEAMFGDMSNCTFPKRTYEVAGDCKTLQEYPDTVYDFINNNKKGTPETPDPPGFYTHPHHACDVVGKPGAIFAAYKSSKAGVCTGGKRLVQLAAGEGLPAYDANGNGYVMYRRN